MWWMVVLHDVTNQRTENGRPVFEFRHLLQPGTTALPVVSSSKQAVAFLTWFNFELSMLRRFSGPYRSGGETRARRIDYTKRRRCLGSILWASVCLSHIVF